MVFLTQDLKLSYETMLAEVPIVVKNSFLMNALLMELQQQITLDVGGTQFLDLGTAGQTTV
jgi:hypothetical protein